MLLDGQGRCLRSNKYGLSMMQVSEAELIGKEFGAFWPEELRPQVEDALQRVRDGKHASFDAYRSTANGRSWWAVVLAPICDEQGGVHKIISIAADITDRKKAEEERVASYERHLAVERLHNREKERLLMDLHDGIGGIATNIKIIAEMGQRAADGEGMRSALGAIVQLSRESISEIRGFMHSLDLTELSWRSLAAELQYQGTRMVEPHAISFRFTSAIESDVQKPGSLLWVNLFKIYKEILTNVVKHSRADQVAVGLSVTPDSVRLTVKDNGVGWAEQETAGRGLPNIRKRAGEMRGQVTLRNDNGLLVVVEVPLPFAVIA